MPIPGAAVELFVITLSSRSSCWRCSIAAARVASASASRRPGATRAAPAASRRGAARHALSPARRSSRVPAPADDRSRAAAVADAVAATQRRETGAGRRRADAARRPARGAPPGAVAGRPGATRPPPAPLPLGQSFRRRTRGRVSASAGTTGHARHEQAEPRSARRLLCRGRRAGRRTAQDALRALAPDRLVVAWIARRRSRCCEALALILLMPLKTVEPYTLLVDRNTGFVQALKPLDPAEVAPDTALTQSFLVQYVIARESFDIDTLQTELPQGRRSGRPSRRARDYLDRHAGLEPAEPARPLSAHARSSRPG